MIAVIFEVVLNSARASRYFDLAAALRPELEKADGFLSIERFQSMNQDNKYVSLSFWRDRAAVDAWYRHAGHRDAQLEGRESIFENYRIRVAEVFRDYDLADGRPQV